MTFDAGYLAVSPVLGELTPGEVIIYYDGPRMFTCTTNADGDGLPQTYLVTEAEDEENGRVSYLYLPITERRLATVMCGDITMHQAIVGTLGNLFFVTRFTGDEHDAVKLVDPVTIPEWQLPLKTLRLQTPETYGDGPGAKPTAAEVERVIAASAAGEIPVHRRPNADPEPSDVTCSAHACGSTSTRPLT